MTEKTINNGWADVQVREDGSFSGASGRDNIMGLRDMFTYRGALYLIMGRRNKSGKQLDKEFSNWALDQNYLDPIKMDRAIGQEVDHGHIKMDVVSKGKDKWCNRLTLTDSGWKRYKGLKLIGNLKLIQRRMDWIIMERQEDGSLEPMLTRIT